METEIPVEPWGPIPKSIHPNVQYHAEPIQVSVRERTQRASPSRQNPCFNVRQRTERHAAFLYDQFLTGATIQVDPACSRMA
ncbi:MAG: hypothetical protein Q8K57_16390 [Thiobacillus sp.]|nr:hypothetical protein [Gammaproteobacteria bacterium]MBU4499433.1 hypothetical protein [Gammaproteobacteria bacterium]MDP1926351.1 hypothetical protein [Thiobacillus sp.]MDP3126414.1 hypothetical protein [Thiobacillus sp.]